MPRPEGSGRAPGTPNKRSREFRARLDEISAEVGFDLIRALVVTATGDREVAARLGIDDAVMRSEELDTHAMQARKLLAQYGYPALKAVELEAGDGQPGRFTFIIGSADPTTPAEKPPEPEVDPLS